MLRGPRLDKEGALHHVVVRGMEKGSELLREIDLSLDNFDFSDLISVEFLNILISL